MREIKFRAWNPEEEIMHECVSAACSREKNKWITMAVMKNGFINSLDDNCVLMQFTGLYDSKKNPIYEGDIVKGTSRLDQDWTTNQKVHFLNGCFMFGNWNAHEYFNKHTEIEVVGNIYENPEILESR